MEKKQIKHDIRKELGFSIGGRENLNKGFLKEKITAIFDHWREKEIREISEDLRETIIKELCDDFLGLGPLDRLMKDPGITEIMVNSPDKVYIEKDGKKQPVDVEFDDESHLRYIIDKMIRYTGRRVDESFPYVDFALEDGSRVNVIIPPLSVGGSSVTIRKFSRNITKVEDLSRLGTIDERISEFLVDCIKAKVSILFSGATGSGKTTTVEVLSGYVDSDERIISIEDALELKLNQEHTVRLLTKPPNIEGKGEVTIRNLFINTLRMRPTRIILGEIRGAEAMDYLQALNSGHRGCLAVIHASSPLDTLTRLETMALYAGLNIPTWAIREQIASGLDLIVQHEQLKDGSRKITYITEVERLENDRIILRDIFRYHIKEINSKGEIVGSFKAENAPTFLESFKKRGVKINENIFKKQ